MCYYWLFSWGFVELCGVFGLVALTSFRGSEGSISLKRCPHERSFKSPLSLEPQSPCAAGQWMLDLWELQGEDPKHWVCCSLEETDWNCPWTCRILACVTGVQPHCSLLPSVIMFSLHVCAVNIQVLWWIYLWVLFAAVFAWGDVTDLIWAGQASGMSWKCWSSKPLGKWLWTAGAGYSWRSHCPYLKISIMLCDRMTWWCKSGTHFAETTLNRV